MLARFTAALATDPTKVINKFRRNAAAALEKEDIETMIRLLQHADGVDVTALAPILASAAVS